MLLPVTFLLSTVAGASALSATSDVAHDVVRRMLSFGYVDPLGHSSPSAPQAHRDGTGVVSGGTSVVVPVQRPAVQDLAVSDRPPPGFEELSAPQQALVDLYFGGRPAGRTEIEYTPETIRFLDPSAVLGRLAGLRDPAEAFRHLAEPLAANSALVCRDWAPVPGCGQIEPATFAVVFDETRLRLDLFAGPDLLVPTGEGVAEWLPDPAEGTSALLTLAGAASLQQGDGTVRIDRSMAARGAVSFGRTHVQARGYLVRNQAALDTAWVGHDRGDWNYRFGLFEETALAPLGWSRLLGAGVSTSLDLRRNRSQAFGTPLQLYLPRRAQVDILRDGRLIATRRLEAGNQVLDSSDLPEGAYEVTLRINDGAGVREETRFFVRTHDLAPPDRPLFRLEAGIRQPASLFHDRSVAAKPAVARASAAFRLSEAFGVSGTLALEPDRLFLGPGAAWLKPGARVSAQLLASTRGDIGGTTYGTANLGRLRLGLSVIGLNLRKGDLVTAPGQTTRSFLQGTGDIQWVGSQTVLGLRGNLRRRSGRTEWEAGPYALWRLGSIGDARLDLGLELTRSPTSTRGLATLTLFRFSGGLSQNAALGYQGGSDGGLLASGTLGWSGGQEDGRPSQASLRAQRRGPSTALAADGEYNGPLGHAEGYAEHDWQAGPNRSGAGVEFGTTLGYGGGKLSFGGAEMQSAAVIVELTGAEPGWSVPVLVNGAPVEAARTGRATPVPLAPYRTYQVSLGSVRDQLFHIDMEPREVTLYPGSVVRLVWDVTPVKVVIARILDEAGQPIAEARVEGGHDAGVTTTDGWTQLEVASERELRVSGPAGACRLRLPASLPDSQVAMLGDLTCRRQEP